MGTNDMSALTVGMTFAIIALSLTLLTGYAGEINLAPVSFGAIATIIVFHLGSVRERDCTSGSRSWGLLLGVAVTAGRRRAHRPARPAAARPVPGPGHPGLRRLRLRHDHRRHRPAHPAHLPHALLDLPQRHARRSRRSRSGRST